VRPVRLLAACLVGVLAGCQQAVTESPSAAPSVAGGTPYSLVQMNLCLSGLAPCLEYPDVVREAIAVIDERNPDAVTLNEVCRGDVDRIAARTGYHQRFATVLYRGRPLPCRSPRGRGVFGNAVLTRAAITGSVGRRFAAQSADPEQRGWLCVATARRVSVCTTHLSAPSEVRTAVREQCDELGDLLAARASRGPTIAAGDINGLSSCAPPGMWTVTDLGLAQKPGIQHAYGSARYLCAAESEVVPADFTDHDFLYVAAWLVPPADR
jgi:hypothetical protein